MLQEHTLKMFVIFLTKRDLELAASNLTVFNNSAFKASLEPNQHEAYIGSFDETAQQLINAMDVWLGKMQPNTKQSNTKWTEKLAHSILTSTGAEIKDAYKSKYTGTLLDPTLVRTPGARPLDKTKMQDADDSGETIVLATLNFDLILRQNQVPWKVKGLQRVLEAPPKPPPK